MDHNANNPVGYLQEIFQVEGILPNYTTLSTTGPSHAPTHFIGVEVKEYKEIGKGTSKKEAKINAAKKVLEKINQEHNLHHTRTCHEPNCFFRSHHISPKPSTTTTNKTTQQNTNKVTKTIPASDELTITIKFGHNEQRK